MLQLTRASWEGKGSERSEFPNHTKLSEDCGQRFVSLTRARDGRLYREVSECVGERGADARRVGRGG